MSNRKNQRARSIKVPFYFSAGKEQGVWGRPLPFRPKSRWAPFGLGVELGVVGEGEGFDGVAAFAFGIVHGLICHFE